MKVFAFFTRMKKNGCTSGFPCVNPFYNQNWTTRRRQMSRSTIYIYTKTNTIAAMLIYIHTIYMLTVNNIYRQMQSHHFRVACCHWISHAFWSSGTNCINPWQKLPWRTFTSELVEIDNIKCQCCFECVHTHKIRHAKVRHVNHGNFYSGFGAINRPKLPNKSKQMSSLLALKRNKLVIFDVAI